MSQNGPALLAPVIAHRGASADAPENTLAALNLAAEHGASCVEIDVSISADNIAFVHHDDQLDRCTSGSGLLCEHTAEQLDQLDASKGMEGFEGEPLPRLSAVFELLVSRKLGLNLEIKPRAGLEESTVEAICQLVESQWPNHLPLVFSSFCRHSLQLAKDRLPNISRGLLVGDVPDDWPSLIKQFECRNLHCDGARLTADQTTQLLEANVGVYCYTVNDVDKAKVLLEYGAHGVFTDYPKRLSSSLSI